MRNKKHHKHHKRMKNRKEVKCMDAAKLDELIAQAKSLSELGTALLEATNALKEPPAPGEDKFTKAELDAVLVKVDDLKAALSALVPTE